MLSNTSINPNWHEAGHFPPPVFFWIRLCQLNFYQKFPKSDPKRTGGGKCPASCQLGLRVSRFPPSMPSTLKEFNFLFLKFFISNQSHHRMTEYIRSALKGQESKSKQNKKKMIVPEDFVHVLHLNLSNLESQLWS